MRRETLRVMQPQSRNRNLCKPHGAVGIRSACDYIAGVVVRVSMCVNGLHSRSTNTFLQWKPTRKFSNENLHRNELLWGHCVLALSIWSMVDSSSLTTSGLYNSAICLSMLRTAQHTCSLRRGLPWCPHMDTWCRLLRGRNTPP